MIRVTKPSRPPTVLQRKGTAARRALCSSYTKASTNRRKGQKRFEFDKAIYAHSTVKELLKQAQHGKCAFCESKFEHISYGDVEHYRPKAGWRQSEGEPLRQPGYYWLAYEWPNLFLSCTLCNQQFKKNLFPLGTPSRRALSHNDDVARENPLLLDPAADDPEQHISFHEEVPYAINGDPRGAATIEILGLKRAALAEERRRLLRHVKALKKALPLLPTGSPEATETERFLARLQDPEEEYSSMTRAYLRSALSVP